MVRQLQVWDAYDEQRTSDIGPFDLGKTPDAIPRHFECGNYDACLSFAAHNAWDSFGCDGCRRTGHGRFTSDTGLWVEPVARQTQGASQ